jgi:hypothetical protein
LISLDGEVKIVDFGLAKAKGQRETTDPGVVKGKFGYLSPEAAYGDDVDHRTDIFAAGIILWEMLTTERRFLGKTDLDTLMAVRENEWKSPSQYRNDIPEQLDRICRRALSSELTHRYENARAFAEDLAEFLYAYGKPFTSFDLADAVDSAATVSPDSQRPTSQDMAVADAMQEAVNNILHLEDIDNLDLYLAQTFGDVDEGVTSDEGWLEDPRSWADFGGIDSVIDPGTHSDDIEWQERNLEELMMTSSPDSDSTEEVWVDLSDADLAQMKPSQPDASAQLLSAEIERQRHQTEQMKALDKDILAEEQERTQLLSRVKTEQDSGWANVGYLEKKPETQSVASPPSKPGVPGIVWVLVGMLVLAIIAVFALQSQGFIAP